MTRDLTTQTHGSLTSAEALHKIGSWQHSSQLALSGLVWTEREKELVALINDLQRPANPGWLSARIGALLAHYYTPDSDETLQRAIANDWIGALSHLPRWAVEQACETWIGGEESKRKPTPGQIAQLAYKSMGHIRRIESDLDFVGYRIEQQRWEKPSDEQKARAQERVEAFKASLPPEPEKPKRDVSKTQCRRGEAIMNSELYGERPDQPQKQEDVA